jgi:hypothetical protein
MHASAILPPISARPLSRPCEPLILTHGLCIQRSLAGLPRRKARILRQFQALTHRLHGAQPVARQFQRPNVPQIYRCYLPRSLQESMLFKRSFMQMALDGVVSCPCTEHIDTLQMATLISLDISLTSETPSKVGLSVWVTAPVSTKQWRLSGRPSVLIPDGHPHKPVHLNSLGTSFQSRTKCLGDIGEVITVGQQPSISPHIITLPRLCISIITEPPPFVGLSV